MIQNESTLRPTPLSLHCDCDRQTCNGEVVEISTACAKEIYIRCDSASVCPPNSPPRQQAQKFLLLPASDIGASWRRDGSCGPGTRVLSGPGR